MESSLEFSCSSLAGNLPPIRSRIFKVIVIGDSGVGKTCLTYRFCAASFPYKTEATIGVDFSERVFDIEGERIKVQFWDTAGQERFRKSMVQQYYRNVHAIVLVYDITSPSSFCSLPAWVDECRRNVLGQNVPRILVGNKADLVAVAMAPVVSAEQAWRFADAHGMPLYQTSAKAGRRGDRAESIVTALAHRLRRQQSRASQWGGAGGFRVPLKSGTEGEKWTCTC